MKRGERRRRRKRKGKRRGEERRSKDWRVVGCTHRLRRVVWVLSGLSGTLASRRFPRTPALLRATDGDESTRRPASSFLVAGGAVRLSVRSTTLNRPRTTRCERRATTPSWIAIRRSIRASTATQSSIFFLDRATITPRTKCQRLLQFLFSLYPSLFFLLFSKERRKKGEDNFTGILLFAR